MKKVVRLTESDLVRLINKVINEDDAFSFGDKLRSKYNKLVWNTPEHSEDEQRLAQDILDCVESGDFEFVDKTDAYVGKGYTIKVNLGGEEYTVVPRKERIGIEGAYNYVTYVTTPDGEKLNIQGNGFAKKLLNLLDKSDRAPRFRYPKK
jgi:hypothetical protein